MRELRRGVDRRAGRAGCPILSDEASPFDRWPLHWRAVRSSRVTRIGADSAAAENVALVADLDIDVVTPGLMDQRRVRFARLHHVDDGGQLFDIQPNLDRHVFGFGPRVGHAHGDQLAHLAHLVDHQRRLLRGLEAGQRRHRAYRPNVGQVLGGEYGPFQMIGDLDALDPAMSDGGCGRTPRRACDRICSRRCNARRRAGIDGLPCAAAGRQRLCRTT